MPPLTKVKVKDRGWIELHDNIFSLKNSAVKVGYPSGGKVGPPLKKGSDHKPYTEIPDVATIAFFLEFGTSNGIPDYAFLRKAFDKNLDKLILFRNKLYNQVASGNMAPATALGLLGEKLVSDVRRMIRDTKLPANKPSTVARKGSSNPGIDTAQMIQSVQWMIVKDITGLKIGVQVS